MHYQDALGKYKEIERRFAETGTRTTALRSHAHRALYFNQVAGEFAYLGADNTQGGVSFATSLQSGDLSAGQISEPAAMPATVVAQTKDAMMIGIFREGVPPALMLAMRLGRFGRPVASTLDRHRLSPLQVLGVS